MRAFATLWMRELSTYFLSPIATITMIFFLAFMGVGFGILVLAMMEGAPVFSISRVLFGDSPFLWFGLMIVVPIVTMRLVAEERRSGTIETLMTAPVTETAVILAKYFGALTFFVFLWLPTVLYAPILKYFTPYTSFDWMPLLTSYVGIVLIGGFYLSIGLFVSTLSRNQIVAAIGTFGSIGILFFAGVLPFFSSDPFWQDVGSYLFAMDHMRDFSWGILDTRPFVLYLSGTAFMLFLSIKVLEARRWR